VWGQSQLTAFEKVMDSFHSFDNVAGFFIGNEILTTPAGSPAAPYAKAAAHDLKSYRNSKGYRNIPVGYSAADIASLRPMLQNYLACGSDTESTIDFFSLNAYEWCGHNTYEASGYAALNANASTYNIPIFFSETGCNTIQPRTWEDQAAIFGPEMASYWSGSIAYEWIEEANNYGLVTYGPKVDPASPNAPPDGFPRTGTPQPIQPDFNNLKGQWAAASPSTIALAAYNPTNSAPACPASTPGAWEVDPAAPLPTLLGTTKSTTGGTGGTSGGSSSTGGNSTTTAAKSSATSSKTVTATVAAISSAVSTSVAAATSIAFGNRSVAPIVLISVVCWFTVGSVMLV